MALQPARALALSYQLACIRNFLLANLMMLGGRLVVPRALPSRELWLNASTCNGDHVIVPFRPTTKTSTLHDLVIVVLGAVRCEAASYGTHAEHEQGRLRTIRFTCLLVCVCVRARICALHVSVAHALPCSAAFELRIA